METETEVSAQDALAEQFDKFAYGEEEAPQETPEEAVEPEAEAQEETEDAEGQGVQEEAEAAQEEVEQPEFIELEYNGSLYEVPRELEDALLRQKDYTTKTQQLAEQRREAEALQAQVEITRRDFEFATAIQPDLLRAEQIQAQIDQTQTYLRENLETLSATDIERIRLAIDDARQQKDEIAQSLQNRQTEFQQAREQSVQELLNKGTEILQQRIPGWGESHQNELREYGLSLGFTEQDLNSIVDPRQAEVLWKAKQYDALQQGKGAAIKKAQAAPIKPKSRNPMPKETGDKLNLRKKMKSGKSDKAKGEALGQHLADRFGF